MTLLALFACQISLAWETDNFSCQYRQIKDSTAALNQLAQKRIDEALREQEPRQANGKCNQHIMALLRDKLTAPLVDNMETWAIESKEVDKCTITFFESVYFKGFLNFNKIDKLVGLSAMSISPTVQVNGTKFGLDKLTHFMTQGFYLYMANGRGGAPAVLKKYSIPEEAGGYGLKASGVYSYGDIMANYQGMKFWQSMIEGETPYLRCENGQWVKARPVDLKEYVNKGFDESVNCSSYIDDQLKSSVATSVTALAKKYNRKIDGACPLQSSSCADLVKSFPQKPDVLSIVVSPECIAAAKGEQNHLPLKGPQQETNAISEGR